MHDGEALVAWVMFWLFSAITTVATFLIADHHRSRPTAILLAAMVLAGFLALYLGLKVWLDHLGL